MLPALPSYITLTDSLLCLSHCVLRSRRLRRRRRFLAVLGTLETLDLRHMRHELAIGRVPDQLLADRECLTCDDRQPLAADQIRTRDAVQQRPELILDRRPAVRLFVETAGPLG